MSPDCIFPPVQVEVMSSYPLMVQKLLIFCSFLKKIKRCTSSNFTLIFIILRLNATILTKIILKCIINYELKYFQINSFLGLVRFLSLLKNSTLLRNLSQSSCFDIFLLEFCKFLHIFSASSFFRCLFSSLFDFMRKCFTYLTI
jgi:hypothetical protein